jgi:hypothetical protein
MLRGLAIVSSLAITSILSVDLATTAYASCASSYENCEQMAVLVCHDRRLGDRDFIGGSNEGDAEDIAWRKADRAGYNANRCRIRKIINKAQ